MPYTFVRLQVQKTLYKNSAKGRHKGWLCQDDQFSKIEVLSMNLEFNDGKLSQKQINTALLFGVKQELEKHGMSIKTMHSNINRQRVDILAQIAAITLLLQRAFALM